MSADSDIFLLELVYQNAINHSDSDANKIQVHSLSIDCPSTFNYWARLHWCDTGEHNSLSPCQRFILRYQPPQFWLFLQNIHISEYLLYELCQYAKCQKKEQNTSAFEQTSKSLFY